MAQVAGRTGRGDRPGNVLVQTYCPDHPAIVLAVRHDYEGFAASEMPEREKFGVPPFGRIVRLIARGANETATQDYLQKLAALAPPIGRCQGAHAGAPAGLGNWPEVAALSTHAGDGKVREKFGLLQSLMRDLPARLPPPQGIELAIDVDPISML